jgi:trigger factor
VPEALKTTTRELGESTVRVDVEVGPDAVEKELRSAAGDLGRNLKIPGFRKGKVPAEVVIQRVGREAVLDEALRRALPAWYEQAVARAGVATVGDPKLDISDLPEKGAPLAFSIEVAVRPKAKLGRYKGVEAGRREPEATTEEVEAELEALREAQASLVTVEREARNGDFVVLDFRGTVDGKPFDGNEARGYLLELGSQRLMEGFEEQLIGARAGEEREVRVTFPADHGVEELADREAVFATSVKEVKEKRLAELDDGFAVEAGGFDSLDELRAELADRIRGAKARAIDVEFREAVIDAAAAEASIELTPELVEAKAKEMWSRASRGLARRGIEPARYLQMTGKSEQEMVEEARPDAERALRREAVLAAVVEAEGIEVSDDEALAALRSAAAGGDDGPGPGEAELRKMLDRARAEERDEPLREDIAMRKALDLLVEHAKPIPLGQAEAREKLWTPEKDKAAEGSGQIWTPGS